MTPPNFQDIVNKVKLVTKNAADTTARQAKIAKLRMNLLTLQTEKSRHLQAVGIRAYALYTTDGKIDSQKFTEQIGDELSQIERIDKRVFEIEEQIGELQVPHIEVKDVTHE